VSPTLRLGQEAKQQAAKLDALAKRASERGPRVAKPQPSDKALPPRKKARASFCASGDARGQHSKASLESHRASEA